MILKLYPIQLFVLIIFALLHSFPVTAGTITFIPRITVSETYTDNINLSQNDEREEYITQINPGFNLDMDGNRFDATVDYQMQNLFYAKDSNLNQTFHQVNGTSTTQIIPQSLFFDLNANRFQQVSDPEQPSNLNNIGTAANQSDVTTVSASPYLQQNIGQFAFLNMRYIHSIVDFDDSQLNDSTADSFIASLARPVRQTGFLWGLNYNQTKTDFDSGNDVSFKQYSVNLGYSFSTRTRAFVQYGDEDNDFITQNNVDIDQSYWNVNFEWQPGSQDQITLSHGERFFGKTSGFSWTHSGTRSNVITSYVEDLQTNNQTLTQATTNVNTTQNTLDTSGQVFVRKTGRVGLDYNISKTTINFNLLTETREFLDTGDLTRQNTGGFGIRVQSNPGLQYRLLHDYIEINNENSGSKSYENRSQVGINLQLAQNTFFDFSLAHNKRRANSAAVVTDYDQNMATAAITMSFR